MFSKGFCLKNFWKNSRTIAYRNPVEFYKKKHSETFFDRTHEEISEGIPTVYSKKFMEDF